MGKRVQSEAAKKLGLQQGNIGKVLKRDRVHTGNWSFDYA